VETVAKAEAMPMPVSMPVLMRVTMPTPMPAVLSAQDLAWGFEAVS
jgi:hypothetical protein